MNEFWTDVLINVVGGFIGGCLGAAIMVGIWRLKMWVQDTWVIE